MKKRIKHSIKPHLLILMFTIALVSIITIFSLLKLFRKIDVQKSITSTETILPTIPKQLPTATTATSQPTEEIVLGSFGDISGGSVVYPKILESLNTRFDRANKTNELGNRKIKLIALDNQFNPAMAKKQFQKLITEHKIHILFKPMGLTPLKVCLPLIKEHNVLVLFPSSLAGTVRQENLKNIITLRASFEEEVSAGAEYAIQKLLATKFAIFYQNDDYGDVTSNGILNVLKNHKIVENNYIKIEYLVNTADAKAAAKTIIDFLPNALFLCSSASITMNLVSNLDAASAGIKHYIAQSSLYTPLFLKYLNDKGIKPISTHAVPNYSKPTIEIAKQYVQEITTAGYTPDDFSFEAYIAADFFIEIIKQITSPVTPEKILGQIQKTKNYNLKGLTLNFDPQTNNLNNDIWIENAEGKWLHYPDEALENQN